MLKRIATLLLGIGLIGVGLLFFVAPERAVAVQILMRIWPVFLILAGIVRVVGYLIDRRPRSPVGGMMIAALGGILFSASLLGHFSFIQILSKYWFWMLLAYLTGRLLRQYTHRIEDGVRASAFSPGAVVVMLLIVGSGLAANFAAKKGQTGINFRIGDWGVGNYVFGNQHSIEDESPQSFAIASNTRLYISDANGDIEVNSAPQAQATARLIKHIRAIGAEEATEIAKNIHLQITPNGASHQFNITSSGVQQDFSVTVLLTLPQNLSAGVEINNAHGAVKLVGLQGAHSIRGAERVEISRNIGNVTVENPRGAIAFDQIQGQVSLINTRREAHLRAISGPITLDVRGGRVSLGQASGPVQLRAMDAQIEISEIGAGAPAVSGQRIVNVEQAHNSRINIREISGAVTINAERSRIDAEEINGDFQIDSSSDRVRIDRINGAVWIKSENGDVEIEEVKGSTTVDATRDITVRNFLGPLRVASRQGTIRLETSEKLNADIRAVNDRGKIRVSVPEDGGFRLDANTGRGRVKVRGFDRIVWSRDERSYATGYNISESAPLISLRAERGEIQLQSSGPSIARHDQND